MFLNYEQIRMDGGTQPRAELQKEVMEDYAELMRAGVKFPPLVVFHDGENYWLADGFHRMGAALRAFPADPIEVEVIRGTLSDAQWYSFGVNKAHGLRRTNEDKERAVTAALHHPNAVQLSNVQLAEHCGVSEFMIRKYRDASTSIESKPSRQSASTSETSRKTEGRQHSSSKQRPRTGRDGRTINTAKIGSNPGRKALRPRSAAEYHDAKQAGLNVRPPNDVVKLELPRNHVTNCAYDLLRYFTFEYLQDVFAELVSLNQQRQGKETKS